MSKNYDDCIFETLEEAQASPLNGTGRKPGKVYRVSVGRRELYVVTFSPAEAMFRAASRLGLVAELQDAPPPPKQVERDLIARIAELSPQAKAELLKNLG